MNAPLRLHAAGIGAASTRLTFEAIRAQLQIVWLSISRPYAVRVGAWA